jgi:hypothetical protein
MSPEQARGKAIDERTDVWAFGCVLYEMLAGEPPFRGETSSDVVVKIAAEEPDWKEIPRIASGLSTQVETLIRKCLQKDRNLRPPSMTALAHDLDALSRVETRSTPRAGDENFALPGTSAFALFMFAQVGYLAIYFAALYNVDEVAQILTAFRIPAVVALTATVVLAMCGIAVRLYLISAVGWRHPGAGRKFAVLFPVLLVLDSLWAASPLLLWPHLGLGVSFACVALLAYVPFSQRTLIRTIYPVS